jgi:hypothetical protein
MISNCCRILGSCDVGVSSILLVCMSCASRLVKIDYLLVAPKCVRLHTPHEVVPSATALLVHSISCQWTCKSTSDTTTMSPDVNHAHGITCAEAISLLYLLHPVPVPPSRNLLAEHVGCAQGYNLCLSDEVMLVENLAFLSTIEHNVNRIPAVCIHQIPESFSLNVLLAVNRTGAEDGVQYLNRLQEGFESIFALLAKPRHSMRDTPLALIADYSDQAFHAICCKTRY